MAGDGEGDGEGDGDGGATLWRCFSVGPFGHLAIIWPTAQSQDANLSKFHHRARVER